MDKKRWIQFGRIWIWICVVAVMTTSLTSCTTIRKKFTRKKKVKENVGFIPVLEPVDYVAKAQDPKVRYNHYYLLWKTWQKDLIQAVRDDESEKRTNFILIQIETQIQGMQKLLTEEKRKGALSVSEQYAKVKKDLARPKAMQNPYMIQRKIDRADNLVREHLSPVILKDEHYLGLAK